MAHSEIPCTGQCRPNQATVPPFGTDSNLLLPKVKMTDNQNPFAKFGLERAIALRWALRDIKGKRLKLSPVSESDLSTLTNLGLVEMRDDVPVLTQAGHDALD